MREESSTWSVFEADQRSKKSSVLGLASEWGFEKRKSLIVAAQNQSIRTNLVTAKIDKSQGDSLCSVCRKVDESIDHIVRGCSKLAQKAQKRTHDNLGKIVH